MRFVAILLSLALGACVSTPLGNRPIETRRSNLSYSLARTYYDVRVRARDNNITLDIAGPYTEADYDKAYALDLQHSGFSSDRFAVTRDQRGMLSSVTLASRSRANAIAVSLGNTLGGAAALTGDAARSRPTPGNEADTTAAEQPLEVLLYERRWRIETDDVAVIERDIQGIVDRWRQAACVGERVCTPPQTIVLRAPRSTYSSAAMTPSPELCARVLCVSTTARAEFTVEVRGSAGESTLHPGFAANRVTTFTDDIISPARIDFFDPSQHSLAGGVTHLVFVDGALTYSAYARESEVESAVALPFDFAGAALSGVFRVLPIRIAIDIQRHQLDVVDQGYGAPGNTGGAALTSTFAGATDRAAPDSPTAPTGLPSRTTTTRSFVLAVREPLPAKEETAEEGNGQQAPSNSGRGGRRRSR